MHLVFSPLTLVPAVDSTTTTSTSDVPADRASTARARTKRVSSDKRAKRALAAHFAGAPSADVEALLGSISGYHRGVLALYYTNRTWPPVVAKRLGRYAGLVVRLYCADHPGQGSTQALEAAAAERLAEMAEDDLTGLFELEWRAYDHREHALRAYLKAVRAAATQSAAEPA